MREFLRGWKRKIGCITLMMACVFAAGWIRSSHTADELWIGALGRQWCFISEMGYIHWHSYFVPPRYIGDSVSSVPVSTAADRASFDRFWSNRLHNLAITTRYFIQGTVPYWSVVIPLTALSTFLLLSKPRKSPQPKTVPSIRDDGGGVAS